jgi:predicted ferric reductase
VNPHVFWYTARATGIVAWVLLTASVVWGLALSTRVTGGRPKAGWVLDMHRYLGGVSVLYVGAHVGSLVADSYVHFDARSIFVPFASSWRPLAVAWGVASMYVLVCIEATSLLKRHIPKRVWRGVHLSSFALLVMTWVHAFTSGTDMHVPAARWLAFGSAVVIVFLFSFRTLLRHRPRPAT